MKPQASGKRKAKSSNPIGIADFATDARMPMGPKGPNGVLLLNNTSSPQTMLDMVSAQKPAAIAIAGVSAQHLAKLGDAAAFFTQLGNAARGAVRGVLLSHMDGVTGRRATPCPCCPCCSIIAEGISY